MSILSEIIDWAVEQTDWKQDAVRRIIEQGNYTEKDVDEISKILLHKNGYLDSAPEPTVIDKDKFKSIESSSSDNVILKKVESPKNVNALVDEAKLQFAFSGLTIVYGENGVGKSGYSRILKKCCKAREVDNIFSDIFTGETQVPSAATIFYSHNGEEKKLDWIDGQYDGGELEQLVVYDSKCGKVQVTDKNELIYLPSGTDIFKKLIDCFSDVKKEIERSKPQEVKISLEKIDTTSDIYKKLQLISKETDKEKISKELEWSEENDKNLLETSKKIVDANEDEIKKKVTVITKEAQNLRDIKNVLETLEKAFSDEKISNVIEILKNKDESQLALEKLTTDMQRADMLEGTGNQLWQVMYSAAKEFSEKSVYQDLPFPYLGGSCVLCQQSLDEDAKKRMESFSKFAEGKVKKNLDDIVSKINASSKYLEGLKVKIDTSKNILNTNFSCVSEDNCKTIIEHFGELDSRRLKLIECLKNNEKPEVDDFKLEVSMQEELNQLVLATDEKKKEVENSINPETLATLKKSKLELESLKIASSRVNDVCQYIDYLNDLEKFNAMVKELEHGAISRKGNTIITNSLKDSFLKSISTELTKLGGEKIPLFVNSSTKDGKPTFQLSLRGANLPKNCKLDSILSEGEQKIASLAGLLAELDTAKHGNGIILDDPVTSLDHQFRKRIAKRLVEEAKDRQVIIFTHDIAFLFDLEYYAKELNVPTHLQNIRKDGTQSGVIYNSNPWHAQNVKSRLKTLRDETEELGKLNLEKEDYNRKAGAIYGRLRETWERVVEEVLFDEVVTRFGQGIQTQRLSRVYVDDDDYSSIFFEMSNCSKYMVGHDKSLSLSDDRPQTSDIIKDIEKVSTFVKRVNTRKEQLGKTRKQLVEKLPAAQVME